MPWYLQVKFIHLFTVAMWSFSTAVAYRNFIVPAFRAWQREPDNGAAIARRNEFMERFDQGAVLEHVAFPLVLLSGLLMVWLAGWSWQGLNWLSLKLGIVLIIFVPVEIIDYYISHLGGNKTENSRHGQHCALRGHDPVPLAIFPGKYASDHCVCAAGFLPGCHQTGLNTRYPVPLTPKDLPMANHPGLARRARWTTLLLCAAVGAQAAEAALEEIIVTAQKRDENVQDIPITINVVNGAMLDRFSIRDTNDLASSVPGLVIQETPQNLSQVTVRGLGTGAGGESLDQSVGLFIDGVWAGRIREFQASLFDLERVEVIKGSQTALLGKNTSLGAVSIVSRRPGDELAGYVQGDYESEFGSRYANGAVDIPTDFGNYRLAFNNVSEQGYVDNETTGNEVPQRNQSTGRASAQFDVADESTLLLLYQYDDLNIQGDTFQPDNDAEGFIAGLDPTANIDIDRTKNAWTSHADNGTPTISRIHNAPSPSTNRRVGEYLFTALSGWSSYDNQRLTDSDFLSVDYLTTSYDSDNEQFSQEFRLTSPAGQRLDYVAGLFYLYADMHYSSITRCQLPAAVSAWRSAAGWRQPTELRAGYAGVVALRAGQSCTGRALARHAGPALHR